ncbi:MAG: YfhO family protein, partial [Vicinamibacteria bacterium]
FVSFGQPLLANANNQILYPPTWLHLLVRPWTYYTLFFLGHLMLAGLGLYRLALRLGVSRAGAFVGAALWIASGPLLSLGNAWNHLAAAAWLPWVGLAVIATSEERSARAALMWGTAWAVQILAGSPDVFIMTGCLALALLASRMVWRSPLDGSNKRALACAAAAAAFALAVSAAQWIPSLDAASRSDRLSLDALGRDYWSVHPASLFQLVVPLWWYEVPLKAEWRAALFESREPFLFSTYMGLPTVVLAAAALTRRRSWRLALLALLVASSLVALGKHAPFYDLALLIFPPLRILRFPAKGLVLAGFCGALLAGQGFDEWRRFDEHTRPWRVLVLLVVGTTAVMGIVAGVSRWAPALLASFLVTPVPEAHELTSLLGPVLQKTTWAFVLGSTLLAAALARRRGPSAALGSAALIAFLGVGDLAWNHRSLNKTAPRAFFSVKPEVVASIDQGDCRRLFVYDYSMTEGRAKRYLKRDVPYVVPGFRLDSGYDWAGAFGMRMYLVPPIGAAWRLFGSYERDDLGLQPRALVDLNALLVHADGTPLAARVLRLGAVSQVLALHTEGLDELTETKTLPGPFLEPIRLFAVPRPLPRSYVVDGVRNAEGLGALETVVDSEFQPESEVILPGRAVSRRPRSEFKGASRILSMLPDRVVVEAEATSDAHLVLVDAYDPGWRATVDGRPSEVLRANVAFRAVELPEGKHVVEFLYRPRSVVWGLAISGAAIVAGALFVARGTAPVMNRG